MGNPELELVREHLKRLGADWGLLASSESVTLVSHWEAPVEFGASAATHYVPPLALVGVSAAGSALLTGAGYLASAKAQAVLDTVVGYDVSSLTSPVDPRAMFLEQLRRILADAGLRRGRGRLAIEEKSLPAAAARLVAAEFPGIELVDAGPALAAARLVKTDRELDLLRAAAEVNRAGHEELLAQVRGAGRGEFEMWGKVVTAMERRAGRTLHVFGELVTGDRCCVVAYPGGPRERAAAAGDMAIMDMSVRVNGYWSDTTNTMVVGGVDPTREQKRYGVAAREAFHAAADQLRPGRRAHQAFDAASAVFTGHGLRIGHYAGHQIGATVNEDPRLVPYEQTGIRAGMVFSIETGAYEGPGGKHGARMEKSIIVHEAGPEILCDFPWGF